MSSTINASTSSGLVSTADTSGILTLQNNGTDALTVTSGNLQFNSGYGSVATAYGCRAWVNFDGTGTISIRGSGNVASLTDRGTGIYTVNLTTAMPDTNYSIAGICNPDATGPSGFNRYLTGNAGSTTVVYLNTCSDSGTTTVLTDVGLVCAAIFR